MSQINNVVIRVATANGSGSQSSNSILVKSIFRMGLPVSGKNLFPSNIQGLPTWFSIRVNENGFVGRKDHIDIVLAMNATTFAEDVESVKDGGIFIYNSDLKVDVSLASKRATAIGVPFKTIVKPLTDSAKLKKLLGNIVYVGVLAKCLQIPKETVESVIKDNFKNKDKVIETNLNAFQAGWDYASENTLDHDFPYTLKSLPGANDHKVLMTGNTTAALGALNGGCSVMAWYPITPSSSLSEAFEDYASKYRKDENGQNLYSVIQAEDELSAISMVVGAGWAGARAMTATSGPGLSLMAEAAGLSYFAEIPAVIWDVQRVGPSTGLPTRTMQGDLSAAYRLSHGDTEHIVLLPANPGDCYEMAQAALDLAEQFQTLVIVLSDLDIGMNHWITPELKIPDGSFQRGKVLGQKDLESMDRFERYSDVDGDGVPYRTLPGTRSGKAAYFTRGTGHKPDSSYSEDNRVYRDLLDRLNRKMRLSESGVPQPVISSSQHSIGLIYYGSSSQVIPEVLALTGQDCGTCRVRALPLSPGVKDFIENHQTVYVIEQNRDQQMHQLIIQKWPELHGKLQSIHQYDGLPLTAEYVSDAIIGEPHA
jgi:2-oxoglutarate ferredoxin oxidoreductase subunit alpha